MNTDTSFDLDSAVQLTQAELQLVHPVSGTKIPAFVTLAGPEHDVRVQRVFSLMRRRRAEFEKQGKLLTSDPADDAIDELDMLVACTLGWRGLSIGGADVAFSADACKALYSDPKRAWVRDQVKTGLDQRELFIVSSAAA